MKDMTTQYAHLPDGRAQQHESIVETWPRFLKSVKPETIVELGTGSGAFTYWLASQAPMAVVWTFELKPIKVKVIENVNQSFCDIFSVEGSTLVAKALKAGGRTLLICDNGNKPKEVRQFGPLLREGDVLAVHDFGETKQLFREQMKSTGRWKFCECVEEDVKLLMDHYQFHRHPMWSEMLLSVWGCYERS